MGGNWQNPVDASLFSCYNVNTSKQIVMSIKLALLKTGDTIISDMKELVVEDKVQGYLLYLPHKISATKSVMITEERNPNNGDVPVEVTLSPWILLSSDSKIAIVSDWVVTVVNPLETVIDIYKEKISGIAEKEFENLNFPDIGETELNTDSIFKSNYDEPTSESDPDPESDSESEESYIE
jgi:hypothetical protein